MDEIDSEYDVIILGTGFVESLVAAACARIGVKVLHLDCNGYYGGQWASFSFTGLSDWSNSIKERIEVSNDSHGGSASTDDCSKEYLNCPQSVFYNVKQHLYKSSIVETSSEIPAQGSEEKLEGYTEGENRSLESSAEEDYKPSVIPSFSHDTLIDQSRRFNLDLAPKVVYTRGKLVELLISSNVARYLEFKCLNRLLSMSDGKLTEVPCSRSDVFKADSVSLIEKRLLMKFMEFCHNTEKDKVDSKDYDGLTFCEFLTNHQLSPKVQDFIRTSIAMVGVEASAEEGLKSMSLFMSSLGRFGPLPFLFPLYGSGEIPQAFCRLCAVFEGIYMLRTKVNCILRGPSNIEGIICEDKKYTCKHLVLNSGYIPKKYRSESQQSLSRGIFIIDRSIYPNHDDHVTMLHMNNDKNGKAVKILQFGFGTGVCPKGTNVVHMTCEGTDAENDFKPLVEKLFDSSDGNDAIKVLYSLYFNQVMHISLKKDVSPSNLYCCDGPDEKIDYDCAIAQASQIFSSMYPESEFLPRAPDPDEIIFDGPQQSDGDTTNVEIDGDESHEIDCRDNTEEENECSAVEQ